MSEIKPIVLGDVVQDSITGFKGVAVSKTQWITGCDRILVQPQKLTKDGDIVDPMNFDEPMLKIVSGAKVTKSKTKKKTGGPMPKAVKHGY